MSETGDRQAGISDSRRYKGLQCKKAAKGVGYNGTVGRLRLVIPCRN